MSLLASHMKLLPELEPESEISDDQAEKKPQILDFRHASHRLISSAAIERLVAFGP